MLKCLVFTRQFYVVGSKMKNSVRLIIVFTCIFAIRAQSKLIRITFIVEIDYCLIQRLYGYNTFLEIKYN